MDGYMPKCDRCEHYNSCEVQRRLTQLSQELWNISREKCGRTDGFVDGKYVKDATEPQTDWHYTADTPQTETQAEGVWNAGYKTGYDKGYKDAQKVKESPSLVKDLVDAFCEDGTWLERQGVYTLTLAEAKQRAVDIIESVVTDTEQTEPSIEKIVWHKDYGWIGEPKGEE